jgi:hypothetical protein
VRLPRSLKIEALRSWENKKRYNPSRLSGNEVLRISMCVMK